jgi:hypothetical protein
MENNDMLVDPFEKLDKIIEDFKVIREECREMDKMLDNMRRHILELQTFPRA